MRAPIILVTLLMLFASDTTVGADAAGNYAIWGVGRSSCYQFGKSPDDDSRDRYRVFLMGYLTAFNTLSENTYNSTGNQSLEQSIRWLGEYCSQHQMDSFDRAIQQMLDTLYASRHPHPPGRERGWGR